MESVCSLEITDNGNSGVEPAFLQWQTVIGRF